MQNSGQDVAANASRLREPIAKTTREDFHLSRFACYLVAMNGDPRNGRQHAHSVVNRGSGGHPPPPTRSALP